MGRVHLVVRLWVYAMGVVHLVERTLGQDLTKEQVLSFSATDLYGLQQLYAIWSRNTPEPGNNLAGWRAIPNDLETSNEPCPCFAESWRGVLCYRVKQPTPLGFTYELYNVSIVGLALEDASLVGSLPGAIGNLTSLVSLTLTGNTGLVGTLPPQLQSLSYNLNLLNLHGNGFTGTIPAALASLLQLQQLDLSANQFDGPLEIDFRSLIWLRSLNLSRNSLTGNVTYGSLQGLNQLITLDLSSNKFSGPLFNLTSSSFLNTLNLSFNSFEGEIRLSQFLSNASSLNLKVVDLSHNAFTGLIPDFSKWTNLSVLDLSYNQFQASPLPVWVNNLPKSLQILRLKGNNLFGQIPIQVLQDFQQLKILVLDDNLINGMLDIGDVITKLSMLEMMNITNNHITKVLYNGSSYKAIEQYGINLYGNPYCNGKTSDEYLQQCVCLQKCIERVVPVSRKNLAAVIATSAAASVSAIAIFIMGLVFWKIQREKQKLQLQVQQHFAENEIKPTIFTFNQLRSATEEFSESMKIGQGSFGAVYKGYLHANAEPVAVKQLFVKNQQSITDFLNEVVVVTAIKHRNLVSLKGCCVREDQRLLVYEYLDNHDLAHHLFHHKENLAWPARFNICLGVARGLHYLHALTQPRIIHRDIKASNILMNGELQPKIADFGLALFFPDEESHIITSDIAGTMGYWAPEYATTGHLSEKADVYSFGVLLLELVSGRRNLDRSMPEHKECLCQWGRELFLRADVMALVDETLALSKDDEAQVRRIINIALLCLQMEPERRPTMGAVVATLDGSLNLDADAMECVHHVDPLKWARLDEEHPLRIAEDALSSSSLFSSSRATGSASSEISLPSMGNYSSTKSTACRQSDVDGRL